MEQTYSYPKPRKILQSVERISLLSRLLLKSLMNQDHKSFFGFKFIYVAIHSVPLWFCRFGDIYSDPEITICFSRLPDGRMCRSECCEERVRGGSRRNLGAAAF
jgi:hypothetical protein